MKVRYRQLALTDLTEIYAYLDTSTKSRFFTCAMARVGRGPKHKRSRDAMSEIDPHDEIARLEDEIEDLTARLESCRKFILAGRVAVAAGGLVLAALLFGAVRFDPAVMACAMAAVLGGIVAWGSNGSTAKEALVELKAAESRRTELIGLIDLRLVTDRPTLH